jgi:hypothetical protein
LLEDHPDFVEPECPSRRVAESADADTADFGLTTAWCQNPGDLMSKCRLAAPARPNDNGVLTQLNV